MNSYHQLFYGVTPTNHIAISDFRLDDSLAYSYSVKLRLTYRDDYAKIISGGLAMKYLLINPLYYHIVPLYCMYQMHKLMTESWNKMNHFCSKYIKSVFGASSGNTSKGIQNELASVAAYQEAQSALPNNEGSSPKSPSLESQLSADEPQLLREVISISKLMFCSIAPGFLTYDNEESQRGEGKNAANQGNNKKAFSELLEHYFHDLCKIIQNRCQMQERLTSYSETSSSDPAILSAMIKKYERKTNPAFYGKSPSFIDLSKHKLMLLATKEDPPLKYRKVTSISSLSSKKEEKDEDFYIVKSGVQAKSGGSKLPEMAQNCSKFRPGFSINCPFVPGSLSSTMEKKKAYFIKSLFTGIYCLELECTQKATQIKLYYLSDILSISFLSPYSRISLNKITSIADSFTPVKRADNWNVPQIINFIQNDVANYDINIRYFINLFMNPGLKCAFQSILSTFMAYYPLPPLKAKNSVQGTLITIQIGNVFNSPKKFWRYFVANAKKYEYKSVRTYKLIYYGVLDSEAFERGSVRKNSEADLEGAQPSSWRSGREPLSRPQHRQKNETSQLTDKEVESGSSSRESTSYSSYAIFMHATSGFHCQKLIRRERGIVIREDDTEDNYSMEKNKLEILLCGIQAVGNKIEDYLKHSSETLPPKMPYNEIEERFKARLAECKRDYINKILWDKLFKYFDSLHLRGTEMFVNEGFTYEDLRKLQAYSDNVEIENYKYKELLKNSNKAFNREFFEIVKSKYHDRIVVFSRYKKDQTFFMEVDSTSNNSKANLRKSLLKRMSAYMARSDKDTLKMDKETDYCKFIILIYFFLFSNYAASGLCDSSCPRLSKKKLSTIFSLTVV